MALTDPADIAALSALLDQALELPMADRDAWLAALPAEQQRHVPALRGMLARHDSTRAGGFLAGGARAEVVDESVAQAGDLVGAYRLLREIGRGGMGSVWLAERADGAFERQVALKLPRLAWGTGLAERMARERRIGALLEHPHIARLYDAGVDARGRPFIAMEYVEGVAIDVYVRQQALPVREVLQLMLQVIRAVAYAHGRLVVHRDLKPGNVLVSADGQAHLLDFGIAKLLDDEADPRLTQEQGRAMTLNYAAPEQLAGQAVGVQADVYAMGVLLYELLTGSLPHVVKRSTTGALEEAILQGHLAPASSRVKDKATARALRGEVDAMLAMALQPDLARRYATAEALARDIERHLAGDTVSARPDSLGYRLRKGLRRHWVGFGASAVVLLAVLAGGGSALLQAHRAAQAVDRQRKVTEFVTDVFRVNQRTTAQPGDGLVGDALLRQSAVLVSQKFQDEPLVRAQMFGVIAAMFLEMGVDDKAADYARQQIETLSSLGAEEPALFEATLTYAQALHGSRRLADAESQSRRALQLAGSVPERQMQALTMLARVLEARSNASEGMKVVERLEGLAQALGKPTVDLAWAYAVRSGLLVKGNEYPKSGPWFDKAVQLAREVQGPDSPAAARMVQRRGYEMVIHHEGLAARQMLLAAYESDRRRGARHATRADLDQANTWARMFELRIVTYEEALSATQRAIESTLATPAIPDGMRCRAGFRRGDVVLTWGDLEESLRWMAPNAECLMNRIDTAGSNFWVARQMALLLISRGDHEAAERWVQQRYREREGGRNHPWAVWDTLTEAMNLSMSERSSAAQALLDAVPTPPEFPHRVAPIMSSGEALRVARARVLAELGQTDAAWQLVQGRPHAAGQDEPDWSSIVPLYGELLCRRGEYAEGRTLLQDAIKASSANRWEHYFATAWMRGLAGQCALGMNDRAGALALAREARAAFVAQPRVSPYYKAPLVRLERALGLRLPPV